MTVYCFLELSIGLAAIPGKIIIELFDTQVPKVAENFRALCTGEHEKYRYQGTRFHRIVETFTLQGGDTSGTGTGGNHIYDDEKPFAGEDFFWRDIDDEMLLCMAEIPPRSQFFITLRTSPHLNGSHCCLGRVIRGQEILRQISEVEVDEDDSPLDPVTITRCGELEYKGPVSQKPQTKVEVSDHKQGESEALEDEVEVDDKEDTELEKKKESSKHQRNRDVRSRRSVVRHDRSRRHDDDIDGIPYTRRRHDHSYSSHRSHYLPYPRADHSRAHQRDHYRNNEITDKRTEDHDASSIKYKGRGKMVYQAKSQARESYGRLT